MAVLFASLAAFPAAGAAATQGDEMPGPITARVIRVIDGDTLRVRARIWLDQEIEISVRLDGIDAPETSGDCRRETRLAAEAREALADMVGAGGQVRLSHIRYGKYAGRVVARVATASGRDVAAGLVAAGLARPYDGGTRRTWCTDRAQR